MSETTTEFKIVPGVEYFTRRTTGWNWFGTTRWWEVFVVFLDGMNGGGGACIEERWRWNGSSQNIRCEYRNLSFHQTQELIEQIRNADRTTQNGVRELRYA
jgi:hypothetical protein